MLAMNKSNKEICHLCKEKKHKRNFVYCQSSDCNLAFCLKWSSKVLKLSKIDGLHLGDYSEHVQRDYYSGKLKLFYFEWHWHSQIIPQAFSLKDLPWIFCFYLKGKLKSDDNNIFKDCPRSVSLKLISNPAKIFYFMWIPLPQ